jgi:Uma2 family endonuclease
MSEPAARPARYEDLLALPENVIGEIIAGVLYTQPRPAGPHTFVASGLGVDLGGPFDRGRGGPGGWYFADEPELHLGGDVLVPDLAAWRVERLPPQARTHAFFSVAPDWVAEVASPSTTQRDRLIKVPAYAFHGVGHLWLVEPTEGRVEAYELSAGRWLWLGTWGDERAAAIPPFEAVPIDLVRLWESTGLRG